jgi:hypothetical protein
MKLPFFIILYIFFNGYLYSQSNDTIILDSCIFQSYEKVNHYFLVSVLQHSSNDTIRFFIQDNPEDSIYFSKFEKSELIDENIILTKLSKIELLDMFNYRTFDFVIIDDSERVIIDSRLMYYKQANAKFY